MKLTAIIPNFNHGHLLRETVASLMHQTRLPDEIIIVDDGSSDNSITLLRQMAHTNFRLRYIRHEHNLGTAAATNTGIDNARGDFIYMGAADDRPFPELFEKTCQRLNMYGNAGLCGSICQMTNRQKGLAYKFGAGIPATMLLPRDVESVIARGEFLLSCCGAIWRKQAVVEAGCFREELRWHTDWLLLHQVALKHGACFVGEVLSEIQQSSGSYSNAGKRRSSEQMQVLKAILANVRQCEVESGIRRSGALACFGKEMFYALISRTGNWKYFTSNYLRQLPVWLARIEGKKILPNRIIDAYLRRAKLKYEKKTN